MAQPLSDGYPKTTYVSAETCAQLGPDADVLAFALDVARAVSDLRAYVVRIGDDPTPLDDSLRWRASLTSRTVDGLIVRLHVTALSVAPKD